MKILILALGLASFSSFAAEIKVPASEILIAARTLVAQTGPAYSAAGTIKCQVVSTGYYPSSSTCEIKIKGTTAKVKNPSDIISEVAKVNPPTGPVYNFSGKFKATSVSGEFPPYKVSEKAFLTIK